MCYKSMRSEALALAAPGAKDCGFASLRDGPSAARQVRSCIKASLKEHQPFIAGYQGIGTDSGYCETIVQRQNGRWALLDVDYDQTGGVLIGDGPIRDVMECTQVSQAWRSNHPFTHSGCELSPSLHALLQQP